MPEKPALRPIAIILALCLAILPVFAADSSGNGSASAPASPSEATAAGNPVPADSSAPASKPAPAATDSPASPAASTPTNAGNPPDSALSTPEATARPAVSPKSEAASKPEAAREGIPLAAALKTLKADLRWESFSQSGMLVRGDSRILFKLDSPEILFDYIRRGAVEAPFRRDGVLFFPKGFIDEASRYFDGKELDRQNRYRVAVILIDPGHGGKDTGAIGRHTIKGKQLIIQEKDVVLDVAKRLYDKLRATYPDKRIMMTREGDTYPSLEDRVEKANGVVLKKQEAIIYLSIHANASFNKKTKGFEVWYLPPDYRRNVLGSEPSTEKKEILPILNSMMEEEFTTESVIIAKNVLEGLDEQIGKSSPNRGLKEESWFVVRNTRMPSILTEIGFVTNPDEAVLLATPDYLQKIAAGLYNGVVGFIGSFESSQQ
jgi:N-acetylmuramoyl-L-alanine amidase